MQRLSQIDESIDRASLSIEVPDFIGIDFIARKNLPVRRQNSCLCLGVAERDLDGVRRQ